MKALLILTLVSGLNAEPTVYPSLDTCMEAKTKIAMQEGVKDAVCVPHSPIDTTERDVDKFRNMISVFMELIEMIEIHEAQVNQEIDRELYNERPWNEGFSKCGPRTKNGLFKDNTLCGKRPNGLPINPPGS